MFMHSLHASCVGAQQVFDEMPKRHFGVVLDSSEYQTMRTTMIIHVYHGDYHVNHVLIIGCVLHTLT